jgi:cyclophilin family peptidyl-prolyl cis-trans isomerase
MSALIGGHRLLSRRTRGARRVSPNRRMFRHAWLEVLEDRQLLTASLQAIAPVTVPALQGDTIPLLANAGATAAQTFTVTSSNPDIAASIAHGPFWTLGVSYNDSNAPATNFTGTLVYQLFQNLTPNTVSEISTLSTDGYFANTGNYFNRIYAGFVIQGGSPTPTGSEPNPPVTFANEDLQQVAFTGNYQLAMANSGGTDSNSSQFFTTLGPNDAGLGYNYTLFGQLLTGVSTINQMLNVPLEYNFDQVPTEPLNPLTISSATLSSTNPNGTLIIDTTQARAGETATITVTANDADGTRATQSFVVTVGPYAGSTSETQTGTHGPIGNVNFKPYATPVTTSVAENSAVAVQLLGQNTYPDTSVSVPLTYALTSQPGHGTVTNFNSSTGTFTYTPAPGYAGADTFQYTVTANGPDANAASATSNSTAVTIGVTKVSSPTPTPTPTPAPTPTPRPTPLVSVENVRLIMSRKHQLTQILVTFTGAIDSQEADQTGMYRLAHPGKKGSYTAKNAVVVKLRSAVYDSLDHVVALTPKKPFALTKQALQLLVDGSSPSGLQDSSGRYIDGLNNGQAGSNAIIVISKRGAEIE